MKLRHTDSTMRVLPRKLLQDLSSQILQCTEQIACEADLNGFDLSDFRDVWVFLAFFLGLWVLLSRVGGFGGAYEIIVSKFRV